MSEFTNGLPQPKGVLAMTKLRNAVKRIDPGIVTDLRNIRINGMLKGCSGFFTDPTTQRTVYVNTEEAHRSGDALLRTVTGTKDFTGGRNRFEARADLPQAIVDLLRSSKEG